MQDTFPYKILLIKNRAYGDSILGLASVQYLKSQFPKSHITYALPGWILPLYKNVVTQVDRFVPLSLKTPLDWVKTFEFILKERFDFIYELHQTGSTKKFFKVASFLGGAPYFFHNHHTKKGDLPGQEKNRPNIQRDLQGLYHCLDQIGFKNEKVPHHFDYLPKIQSQGERGEGILLGVIAGRPTKMWPIEYFCELTQKINAENPQREIFIPLGSSKQDKEIAAKLKQIGVSKNTHIIECPLDTLPEIVEKCQIYIGNDTGLKHLSIAMGLKSITFFGPESPEEWHPYPQEHDYFFKDPLECRTIKSHFCGIPTCDSMVCLNEFTPDQVMERL